MQDKPWSGSPIPCDKDDLALFAAATNITVGSGTRARFWQDRCLGRDAPAELAPDLFHLCYRKNFSVAKALGEQQWLSGLHRISSESEMRQFTSLWARLHHIVLNPARQDVITWNRNALHPTLLALLTGAVPWLHCRWKLWEALEVQGGGQVQILLLAIPKRQDPHQ